MISAAIALGAALAPAGAAYAAGKVAASGPTGAPGSRWADRQQAQAAPPPRAPSGTGALVVYADLPAFVAATAGIDLRFEDFSRGFTPRGGMRVCYQAVSSASDDPCFAPGALVPGFGIRSSGGNIFDPASGGDSDLIVLGADVLGTGGNVIGANVPDPPSNPTQLGFDAGATAIAMDVYDGRLGQALAIEAYDAQDALIGSFEVTPAAVNMPAFAGFTSPLPVRRVAVNAVASGGGELIGNLRFGGGPGRLQADLPAADFDAVAVGVSATRAIRLSNRGALDLVLGVLPAPAAPFAIAADACSGATLAPGADCVVQFGFAPAYASDFSATLAVPGGDGATLPLDLRGEGVQPRLTAMPGVIDFGAVGVGTTAPPQTLTLANLSAAPSTVTSIAVLPAPFVVSGGSCGAAPFVLETAEQCTLQISFAPTGAGQQDALLRISSDAAPAIAEVGLHGSGSGGGQ
jgi:hypothetical protein